MTVIPEFEIKINGVEYADVVTGKFSREPRDPSNAPTFDFQIPDPFGNLEQELSPGDVVTLHKNGELVFTGIYEDVDINESDAESVLNIICTNKWYKKMSNVLCDSYDFIQDIDDYGVTVNTWDYKVLKSTNPDHALQDLTKSGPPIDGFTPDQVAKALIGEKLLYWHDFSDASHLLSLSTRGVSDKDGGFVITPSNLGVYRNPGLSDVAEIISGGHAIQSTPRLQLNLNGEVYQATGTVESIPFYNGDPNVDVMGNIANARIRVYGEFPDDTGIVVDVCRNGGESFDTDSDFLSFTDTVPPISGPQGDYTTRDYVTGVINVTDAGTSAPTTKSVTYNDILGNTGVNADYFYYEGSTDFSGKAAGNSLAYRITLTTSNTDFTPYIECILFECDTVSDTGITSGGIDAYTDASGITGSEYFEGDLVTQTRLQALSALRFGTINVDDELNHFWDLWLDQFGTLNFKKNRGTTLTREYSFNNEDFGSIQYRKDGSDIWKQCIAYGAGSGKYRTRIVSDEEFSTGGLKSSAVATEFGDAAKVGKYEDGNATTATQLLRKARAVFKLHQKKIESLVIPSGFFDLNTYDFDIGDSIKIVIPLRGINGYFPVEDIQENLQGEPVSVKLGEPRGTLENAISNISSSTEQVYIVRGPQGGELGLSGSGTRCDNNTNGIYNFAVSDPTKIDSVVLKVVTVPYDTTGRAVNISGLTIDAGAAGAFQADVAPGQGVSTDAKNVTYSGSDSVSVSFNDGTADGQNVINSTSTQGLGATTTAAALTSPITQTIASTDSNNVFYTFSSGALPLSGSEGIVIDWEFESSTDNSVWEAEILITDNQLNLTTLNKRHYDNVDSGEHFGNWEFIPMSFIRGLSATNSFIGEIKLQVKNVGGSSQTINYTAFNVYRVPLHSHGSGSLNGVASGLNGSGGDSVSFTDEQDVGSQTGSFTAADAEALFDNLKIGYLGGANGGTGTSFTVDGTTYYEQHAHSFTGGTAEIDFGIYHFAGASGDPLASPPDPPVFGSKISLYVDPINPQSPSIDTQVKAPFGDPSKSVELDEIPITAWLSRTNGSINPGMHTIVVKSEEQGVDNPKGLAKVQFVPIFKYKE